MKYDYLIIRYGEIVLKGKNRKMFYDKLTEQVRERTRSFHGLMVKKHYDHIEIALNGHDDREVTGKLTSVFGIQSIRAAIAVPNDLENMKKGALQVLLGEGEWIKTFKVSARRKNKQFPINSWDLNHAIGAFLLTSTNGIKVDVHHPDLDLKIEVGDHQTRIYGRITKGAGGLPVGTAGKVLLMLSGGIDSPVAGYQMMKRGADIEAIHFHSPPYTNDRAKQKVIDLAEKLKDFGGNIKLHVVPFTETQLAIRDRMPENYRMTIMRRMMLRIAEKMAAENGALAVVTGESLGQVASQTLESMHTINEVTNIPVLRPLVAMDKVEIMAIAQKIDTYEISIRPYEDCCTLFLPRAPKTKPNREHANRFEKNLPIDDLIASALAGTETIEIGRKNEEMDTLL
ncbi:tRNA uracil 4-sulfurtransferase ThiI [Camelliibacillus cellulosilyticus]|uniref:Probable tRNA sulfurtransferase n=1 Tax=Camelliibacillus cellulosilyticus TaxID=2174486 RepID=A0ABV9GNS7_9BACL